MTQRTQEAIDVFLDALNEGTLAKGTCTACAVGNLAAFGMGVKIKSEKGYSYEFFSCPTVDNIKNNSWGMAFCTSIFTQEIHQECFNFPIFQYFKFTPSELAKIEHAFETNTFINHIYYPHYSKKEIRDDQIKGLEAVVKVMLELDENTEETYQEVFTSKALALAI